MGVISNDVKIEGSIGLINDNHFFILYPGEYVANPEKAELETRYNNLQYDYQGFDQLIGKISTLFYEIKNNSVTVSSKLDVGIQVITDRGIEKILVEIDMKAPYWLRARLL